MNRAVQKLHRRRCALKNNVYGGGLAVNPEASFLSENGVPYAENQHYSDCYSEGRPGALDVQANPQLAQVAMAGGYSRAGSRSCGCNMRGGSCGCSAWKLRGGQYGCGKAQTAWLGGKRSATKRSSRTTKRSSRTTKRRSSGTKRKSRKQRGGNKGGFEMAVNQNIGGNGPIAEPVRAAIPCDARAGMQNPFTATPVSPDTRAAFGYSLTPNTGALTLQAGGSGSIAGLSERVPNFEYSQTGAGYGGNAYDASCYRAPGSEMPVYPATSAGFNFTPSTEAGATLPDGVTAFNEVVAHAARLGGARRRMTHRKKSKRTRSAKKAHRSRRH